MKRVGLFLLFAFLIVLLLLFFQGPEGNAPQFLPLQALPVGTNYLAFGYEPTKPHLTAGDKLWVMAATRARHDWFLYDLKAGKIQGQLIAGQPHVLSRDQSKVLCSRPFPSRTAAFRDRLARRIETLTSGKLQLRHLQSYPERYWLLDLNKNTAEEIGDIPIQPGTPCTFSPDGRHGYTTCIDAAQRGRRHVFCFDLERRTLRHLDVSGWPSGWWDDSRMVLQIDNDFVLYDLTTGKNAALFSSSQIKDFLQTNGLAADFAAIHAFAVWNGRENDLYLAEGNGWPAKDSFLIKVERPTQHLKLISPRFKFDWLDDFDPGGNLCLYDGRDTNQDDAVFLHNFQTGQDQTLVPSNGNDSVSIPRFYHDAAIYLRSNTIWKINLDGTHNVRIFPP